MQFESEFRFDMDENFSMCSQSMSCPSATASFSSASSAYDPFTPTSRRSTPNELTMDFENACHPYGGSHPLELTPPSATASKFMFGPVKAEPEDLSLGDGLPTTPVKSLNGFGQDHEGLLDMNLASQASTMGTLTPSNSFGLYTISPDTALRPTSFMMTPTHSLSGSEIADTNSSWSCANDSPVTFLPHKAMTYNEFDGFNTEHHPMSPMDRYQLQGVPSPDKLQAQRRMMHEIQRKSSELQRAQIRASRKRAKQDGTHVDVVRRAMCKCDYPGCHKAFRRNEHLKRHKQTFHGEGPNRFSCEFCGKDQFNRQDNLNNHRKLHARPNSRNRGVEFIPAAVAIIEQEERSRKRRAPPKSKTMDQRADAY